MSAFWAEFMGTFLLLFVGNGVVANVVLKQTKAAGDPGSWIMITTAWGLAVYIGVVVAGPYSGAHLNPAVSLALWLNGDLTAGQLGSYAFAQLLDGGAIRGSFCTAPSFDKTWNNFLSEAMGTFVLVFVVFYISPASLEADPSIPIGLGSVGALPVALLVWVIGLGLGGTTGYAINPARDLGPRLMHQLLPIKNKIDSGWSYAWIPVVAPLTGAGLAWWVKELLLTTL